MARFTHEWLLNYNAKHRPVSEKSDVPKSHETESAIHAQIESWLKQNCIQYFTGRMDRSTGRTIGEPDYTIMPGGGRVIFAEIKTIKGKLSPEQNATLYWLKKNGCEAHVIRSLAELTQKIHEPSGR